MKKIINILLILVAVFSFIPFGNLVNAGTLNYQINSSTDDASTLTGGIFLTSTTITIGIVGQDGLFRFTGVTIPNGSVISNAYIKLYAISAVAGASTFTIKGEQSNSAATFSTYANYIARSTTTASVNWNIVSDWAASTWYDSDDIKTIIQELVNDYSGLTNADIALFVQGTGVGLRVSSTYNYDVALAPKLYIEYQNLPTVTTQAVTNRIYSGAAHYALLNGNVVSNGDNTTDIRGFAYGTTSVPVNPGNVLPTVSGYSTNQTTYSSALGAYTENITGMAAGTRYYVRAIAHNGIGWAYGDEVNFTTLTTPTITTLSATSTTNSTSILNSQVTFDGNSTCNITFGWGLVSGAWAAYTVHTDVSGTFTTGQFPALNLSSLNASATYYYMVRIQNPYGTAYGTEVSFTTASGIAEPTNLKAISTANSVSLTWNKGVGTQYTLLRYSTGSYPTAIDIGTMIPLTQGSSSLVSGLSPGVTYYVSAWGKSATLYSSNYTTVMVTTLAANTVSTTTNTTATPNAAWIQTPTDVKASNIPIVGALVTWVSTVYNQPANYLWYFLWIMAGMAFGVVTFRMSEGKLFVAFLVEALWFGFGVALGLIMLWIVVIFMIIAAGMSFFGDRR